MVDGSRSPSMALTEWVQAALFVAALGLLLFVGYLLFSNSSAILKYLREAHYEPLAIATSPSGANVYLDGRSIGITPVTVKTFAGAHSVEIVKSGYAEQSLAINLERDRYNRKDGKNYTLTHAAKPWIVNLKLERISAAVTSTELPTITPSHAEARPESLQQGRALRSTPPPASTGIVDGRLGLIEQRLNIIDQKIDLANTVKLPIWGTLAAIFLTLGGFLFALLRKAP